MKKLLPALLAVLGVVLYQWSAEERAPEPRNAPAITSEVGEPQFRDGRMTSGRGTVVRILADDNDGSRHQRFILELASGRTLLVAHNIDLAPRIGSLRRGDVVQFRGVFEHNERGGVIHWTHHDPQGRRAGGWLEHRGRRYE